jgi:inosose dehydratase
MTPDGGNTIMIANAPVSFGAFEITVGIDPAVPDGVAVLDAVQSAGYRGIDLGPVGYLGSGAELAQRLSDRGLGLAGGYLELPFSEPERLAAVMPELDALLDTFDAVAGIGALPPKPTLADFGMATMPGGWTTPAGTVSPRVWRRLSNAAAGAAMSRRSTTKPEPISKRRGKYPACWR